MDPRIIDPSLAPPGWFDDRAAKFESAYPDFYKHPDIAMALEKAEKAGVPINALKVEIGFDLRDRDRMIANTPIKTLPTDITQKKAGKALKTVEDVIGEISGLRDKFEKAMERAILEVKDFPTDHLNSDEYKTALATLLADGPSAPDVPPTNGQMMLGALSIEKATSASLYLLDKIREALIVTMDPKEPPMMAILKRGLEGTIPKKRGVKPDYRAQGIIRKYAEFFRETTGTPQDGIAGLIVGHLLERREWLEDGTDGVTPAELYKRAREAAEKTPNPWPFGKGAWATFAEYHQNKQYLKEKVVSFLKGK
ncbi:MAG: hypothetical protein ACYCR5_10670 [Leptospirillum sp.]